MTDADVLILYGDTWHDDFSQQKYQLIILTLPNGDVSFIDIFMLAASRLYEKGEFILRFEKSLTSHEHLIDAASTFDFKLITNKHKLAMQYVFRYDGKATKPGYQIALASTYSDSCQDLFENVFGHKISKEFWSWKYRRDQEVHSVVALANNKAVAHYGLCDRGATYNGVELGFSQACDVMVDSSSRGSIASSVFYELVKLGEKPFYAENSSVNVIYGFPHGRHYKLGARLKLYEPVSPIMEVVFEIPKSHRENTTESIGDSLNIGLVDITNEPKEKFDIALTAMFSAKGTLLLQRNHHYILQRYVFHPQFKYDIYCYSDSYFVIKITDNKIFLMDYFGELELYFGKLDGFVAFLSRQYPGYTISLWCLKDISSLFINPQNIVDTGAVFVCKKYTPNLPTFKQWWITMGDTEFL